MKMEDVLGSLPETAADKWRRFMENLKDDALVDRITKVANEVYINNDFKITDPATLLAKYELHNKYGIAYKWMSRYTAPAVYLATSPPWDSYLLNFLSRVPPANARGWIEVFRFMRDEDRLVLDYCATPNETPESFLRRYIMSVNTNIYIPGMIGYEQKMIVDAIEVAEGSVITPHECPKCPSTFERDLDLQCHLVVRHATVPDMSDLLGDIHLTENLECKSCRRTYPSHTAYAQHMRKHGASFPCSDCDEIFTTEFERSLHSKEHGFPCLDCSVSFQTLEEVDEHMSQVHDPKDGYISVKDGKFACVNCRTKFDTEEAAHGHVLFSDCSGILEHARSLPLGDFSMLEFGVPTYNREIQGELFSCNECPIKKSNEEDILIHVRTKHGYHVCKICLTDCKSKEALEEHGECRRTVKCDKCNTGFISSALLDRHFRSAHGRRRMKRPSAQYGRKISKLHTEKMRSDLDDLKDPMSGYYCCPDCDYNNASKAPLIKHFLDKGHRSSV